MPEYQTIARKYRPMCFAEVLGQEAIVRTLVNAIKKKKTAHAYLFSGSRGTGKTTLARLFAKALNCKNLSSEGEPCNACPSCKEITLGSSLDVLEIDGASHRGIEDIRQINETIGFMPSGGKYKIYLIDEVHMLTKEAFNALLKSLEEPPEKVKFFFATTEPHKIPLTIVSRAQRFHLLRISEDKIQEKLAKIGEDLKVTIEKEALALVARFAEGSLRDAESLLDQVLSYEEKRVTAQVVMEALGLLPKEMFFQFSEAQRKGDFSFAFVFAEKIYSSGVNLSYFIQEFTSYFRTLFLLKIQAPVEISLEEKKSYFPFVSFYKENGLIETLEILQEAAQELKVAHSQKIALEMLLLRLLRLHHKVSLDSLFASLEELEKKWENREPSKEISKEETKKEEVPVKQEATPLPTKEEELYKQSKQDTLMRFAAKELKGSLKKG